MRQLNVNILMIHKQGFYTKLDQLQLPFLCFISVTVMLKKCPITVTPFQLQIQLLYKNV